MDERRMASGATLMDWPFEMSISSIPGAKLRVAPVEGWYDCGKPDTLLETNDHLLRTGLGGIAPSALPVTAARNLTAPDGRSPIVPFATVFPLTASGKAELASEPMAARCGFRVPTYRRLETAWPLALITPSSSDRTNATFGGHAASRGTRGGGLGRMVMGGGARHARRRPRECGDGLGGGDDVV